MARIGNVPKIVEVKQHLDQLVAKGLVKEWSLPYENILTRLSAAIFFLNPSNDAALDDIWRQLDEHPMFTYRKNEEKKLSPYEWRVEFNKGFELM
jgi:hypothetical protein